MTIHEDAPPGPTFADVLNGLSFGRRAGEGVEDSPRPTPVPRSAPAPQPVLVEMPDDDPAMVRPYAMTGGRTRPTHDDLDVEALVSTTSVGEPTPKLTVEQRAIAARGAESQVATARSALAIAHSPRAPACVPRLSNTITREKDASRLNNDVSAGLVH
jgi:hypothetical protein